MILWMLRQPGAGPGRIHGEPSPGLLWPSMGSRLEQPIPKGNPDFSRVFQDFPVFCVFFPQDFTGFSRIFQFSTPFTCGCGRFSPFSRSETSTSSRNSHSSQRKLWSGLNNLNFLAFLSPKPEPAGASSDFLFPEFWGFYLRLKSLEGVNKVLAPWENRANSWRGKNS